MAWSDDTLIGARWTRDKPAVSTAEDRISRPVWRGLQQILAEVEAAAVEAVLVAERMQSMIVGKNDCDVQVGSL